MKRPPVFLSAFANQQDDYLQALKMEERSLRDCFSGRHDQNLLEYQSLGNTNLEDIYRVFHRFHNRIAIFHYGGHSNSGALLLEGDSTRAANLSTLMSMQDGLQLVVLNGCSNQAQAKVLLEVGVKVIVGTSCPINDDKAVLFATQFYQGLAAGSNIRQAFDSAMAYLSDKRGVEAARIYRGLDLPMGNEDAWALYYQDEEDLLWALPDRPAGQLPAEDYAYQEEVAINHPKVNGSLILQVATGLGAYFPEIKQLLLHWQQTKHPEHYINLQEKVREKFPSVIGSHIAALFSPKARVLSRQRLHELNYTYLALCRYLASIALSNLWEASLNKQAEPRLEFQIHADYRDDLLQYLKLSTNEAATFDYIWLTATIHRVLKANHAPLFMEELGVLHQQLAADKPTYDAYRFLHQELCQPMAAARVHKEDIGELCLKAEYHLGRLLQRCAFLATYELATIREIQVNKGRREATASFLHNKGLLRGSNEKDHAIYPAPRADYIENQSVVVTKSFFDSSRTLNLSPFLIDRNAYANKQGGLPDIYFYYGICKGQRSYQRANEMRDMYTVERTAEDYMMQDFSLDFNLEFDGMEVLYELFDSFSQDLKLR